jgi:uncharacterized protein YcaQ
VEERVLGAIEQRGALPTRFFEGSGGAGMWNWKPEKRLLENLFAAGRVVVAGRDGFQRLYALPEHVIPKAQLDAPVPSEDEFVRGYALRAVRGRGALTETGIVEHCRFKGGVKVIRPHLDRLVADGLLRREQVAEGGPPVVVPADAELDGAVPGGVLLCPFDNLMWDRPFLARVFGFRHLIEVYKREHERQYGYYVLPFLYGDRLVGRADLKADRAEGVLHVKAFHLEPGVRRSKALESAFDRALERLARIVGTATIRR